MVFNNDETPGTLKFPYIYGKTVQIDEPLSTE